MTNIKAGSFGNKLQINARKNGFYDKIATTVNKCVFCDLKDKYILHEDKGLVLTVNIFPYINGQLLIIPRKHIESLNELSQREWLAIHTLSKRAIKVLESKMKIKGVWMILREGEFGKKSGKTVRHFHWNIMPYKEGINTWHYQNITISPIDLANKLRPFLKK